MNVFEKYLDNVAETANLIEIINQLCTIHLIKTADSLKNVFNKRFIKFNRWEIDIDDPENIIIYFDGEDLTNNTFLEMSKKFPWNNLLIKIDGYE